MAVDAISGLGGATSAQSSTATQDTAANAFGVGFEDLLRIVLTQLTYQDPLKPMENFEFVSQLAQFSQIQQSETGNDRLASILQAEGINQATGLLGRQVDIPSSNVLISGVVKSVVFDTGEPRLTIETADKQTISGIALSTINRVAQGN